jgi:hypothetical protein
MITSKKKKSGFTTATCDSQREVRTAMENIQSGVGCVAWPKYAGGTHKDNKTNAVRIFNGRRREGVEHELSPPSPETGSESQEQQKSRSRKGTTSRHGYLLLGM